MKTKSCLYFFWSRLSKKNQNFKYIRLPFKRKKKFDCSTFKFIFGNRAFFLLFQSRIEQIYLKILKRLVRKKYRKRKSRFSGHKYWVRYNRNIFFTKKSKNSRMGSGRGKFVRTSSILRENKTFMEFRFFDYYYLSHLKKAIRYKLNLHLMLFNKKFRNSH